MFKNEAEFNKVDEKKRAARVLKGTVFFPFLTKPRYSEKYKSYKYSVTLGLDEANVVKAKEFGLTVKPPKEPNAEGKNGIPMPHVELYRGTTKDMPKEKFISLVDSMQNPLPQNINIGNGSTIACKFGTFWHPNNGGGVGNALYKVLIKDLVEFNKFDADLGTEEGGFVYEASESSSTAETSGFDTDVEFDDDDGFEDIKDVG